MCPWRASRCTYGRLYPDRPAASSVVIHSGKSAHSLTGASSRLAPSSSGISSPSFSDLWGRKDKRSRCRDRSAPGRAADRPPVTTCPREDLNLHALASTGPQPAAYANSATGASICIIGTFAAPVKLSFRKAQLHFRFPNPAATLGLRRHCFCRRACTTARMTSADCRLPTARERSRRSAASSA